MSTLEQFQAEVILHLDAIVKICERYQYKAVPIIVMRHEDGPQFSQFIGNDLPKKVAECVLAMQDCEESSMSLTMAAMRAAGSKQFIVPDYNP